MTVGGDRPATFTTKELGVPKSWKLRGERSAAKKAAPQIGREFLESCCIY